MGKAEHRKTLTREEWVRVFNRANVRYPTGKRDRAMYYFMYYTGLRVGELVYLRFDDVDLDKGVFTTPKQGKTGQRKLGLPDSKTLDALLSLWLDTRREWGCEDSQYFFCTQSGGRISEGNFYNTFVRHAKSAGFDDVHPHCLRHSYATMRIHEGVNPLDLQSELGHKSLKTTMIYLHQENQRAVENMRQRALP